MPFVKTIKNKAYSKRYQTKWRRRRQGKTDYQARKRLVVNDKHKYDAKKYRFVVRRTNRRIITSVIYATMKGDMTMCTADSLELKGYGVSCGLTNYAAAYATGLLCARRLLKDKKLDTAFKGNEKVDGTFYSVAEGDHERRPFKAFLDVGLVRTTTGNRVFGAMKGASDGGLHIPHETKRFPGFRKEKAEAVVDKRGKKVEDEKAKAKSVFTADEHREHIFGIHVQEYYDLLKEQNAQRFKKQFSQWEKALKGKSFEDIYTALHKAIRAKPERVAKKEGKRTRTVVTKGPALVQKNSLAKSKNGGKWIREKKIGKTVRQTRVQDKMKKIIQELHQ
jgi:large subunit ribosomal protein L5e